MARLLKGRTIVVTGAGGGLGRAYALAIGAEGGNLVIGDIDGTGARATVEQLRSAGARALAVPGDISDRDIARGLIRAGIEEFGAVDGLVNNAGISYPGTSWETSDDAVAHILGVNVAGVIYATHEALAHMVPRGTGSIVNVVSGAMLGMPELTLYGGTKSAILGLTYGWAVETSSTRVRVNALSPLARTGMSDHMSGIPEKFKGPDPESIAPVVVALLADGSTHLHGQTLRFDGQRLGFMAPPAKAPGVKRDEWSPVSVLEAFDEDLRPHMQPFGLGTGKG